MDTTSLTYKELADRLGVKLDSAKKMVRRKRWQRTTGNDGQVRILVPLDALPSPQDTPADSPDPLIAVLEEQIAALREILEAERRRAEAEGHRADAAELDRDRWHALAMRPWWRRLVG